MKLTEKTKLTRVGKLVSIISKWDTESKGLSRDQLRELSVKLVLDNPGFLIGSLDQIESEIIRNHLVAYDTQSGLYFVCVRMPVSPYPEDFKSPGRLSLEELRARYTFEEQLFNRKLKSKYCEAKGFETWAELSLQDFNKWKTENGIVFIPGIKETTPEKKPKKKTRKKTEEEKNSLGKLNTPKYYNLGEDNTLKKLNLPKGFNFGG
jgi:hypothetical protein